ncbi:MAG: tetratricopeptide repeat protein [Anaerolineales bacterium]|jgi:ATP/maltotriose-dependent transcriptional regulator MalT/two-component SAPR family response regulator
MARKPTPTKVILPQRRKELFTRQRLINLLYDLLDEKLILVIAPAGYGKTSLLIDFAYQVDLPVCWYAVDDLDQTPERFFAYFIATLHRGFPTFGEASKAALKAINPFNPDINQLVSVIVNDAYEHIQEHFLIILDDYHLVSNVKEIQAFINRFINASAENCHLILSSRTLLSLPDLPLLVARSQVGGIGFEELAFRADEIQSFVLQNYHVTLSDSASQDLARDTEGWITGLMLSAQVMGSGMTNQMRAARVTGIELYTYLAQEILDQQTAEIRDFLLRTSFLDEFDVSLCASIWGSDGNWRALINQVVQNNLFVLPVGVDGRWLRYHHLFGEFLRTQLEKERPDQVEALLRRIAHVYTEREEWARAYSLYKRIGDNSATAELVEKAGTSLIRNAQFAILAKWIDALPVEILDSHPSLISHKGTVLLIQGQVEKSLEYLNRAEAAQREHNDWPGLAHTLARRATAQRYKGNYKASIHDGLEALELSRGEVKSRSVQAEACRAVGVSLQYQGQLDEAREKLDQSLLLYESVNDEQNTAMVHMELGMCCQYQGDTRQAVTQYEQALAYWQGVRNTSRQSFVLNNLGSLHHLSGNYIEAAKLFEQALTLARSNGILRSEAYLLFNLGNLYADLEANDSAWDAFEKTREACQTLDDHFLLLNIDLAESSLARHEGKFSRANAYLLSAQNLIQKSHSSFENSLWAMEAGNLSLAEKKVKTAIKQLSETFTKLNEGGQKLEAASTALLLSRAYEYNDDHQMAHSMMVQALGLVSNLDSIQPLVVVGRSTKEELQKYVDDINIGPAAIKLLSRIENFERQIASLRRKLRPHAATVLLIPPKLSIYALGRSYVKVDGKPVNTPSWANQKRARELFFFLVAHANKGMTKEEIGVILWPESSSDQLRLQFRNTLYYVRYALGQEVIISTERHYLFNTDMDYSYDVQEFERTIGQAEKAETPEKKIELLHEGTQLYQGEFYPEGEGDWVMTERQRLAQIYEHSLLTLAQLHLEKGETQTALIYCQTILAENPCMESAHRLAMQAYAALGNRSGIANQYEQCKQLLQDELGLEPSTETTQLYKILR